MSDLVAIAFPAEAKAEEVRQKLVAMQKKYLIDLGDAVIALKELDGQIKLDRPINTTSAGTAVVHRLLDKRKFDPNRRAAAIPIFR